MLTPSRLQTVEHICPQGRCCYTRLQTLATCRQEMFALCRKTIDFFV